MDSDNKYGNLELQKKLLTLMKEFHSFATKNDIDYRIMYGTLLGAIRHKGFIPWDDDIDIVVERKEYDKLIKLNFPGKMKLILSEKLENTFIDVISMNGVNIDVFILDDVPRYKLLYIVKVKLLQFFQALIIKKDIHNYSFYIVPLIFFTNIFGKLVPHKSKIRCFRTIQKFGNLESKSKYKMVSNAGFKEVTMKYNSSWFFDKKEIMIEDTMVVAPIYYDEILTITYGDWRTPTYPDKKNINYTKNKKNKY